MWRIMRSKLGELFSLSSLVQTLPTSSDGLTALKKGAEFEGAEIQRELQSRPAAGQSLTCRAPTPAGSAGGRSLWDGGS